MTKRYQNAMRFSPVKGRQVEADFTGAEVTANGGLPLLAVTDRRLGLTESVAQAICDDRRRRSVAHSTVSIVRQRLFALLLGHEDLNDHDALRRDTALQAAAAPAVGRQPDDVACQCRLKIPQKCRSKIPQLRDWFNVAHRCGSACSRTGGRGAWGAAAALHRLNGGKLRLFDNFEYAAGTWPRKRRVVVKAEHNDLGPNTRFVVTNLDMADDPQGLYDDMYCERGEMENRIKDQQLGLFADRASSSDFDANQLRLLLSGLAHTLLEGMRRMALEATELAKASPETVRLTLLKVGAVVLSNTRRVRLLMSRSHPKQALFRRVAAALAPQPP